MTRDHQSRLGMENSLGDLCTKARGTPDSPKSKPEAPVMQCKQGEGIRGVEQFNVAKDFCLLS